jgi:hypothetical protein
LKQWIAKLYHMARGKGMRVIPAARIARKYHERIAVNSMDKEQAESYVTRTRMRSRLLMAQREAEIEAGLVHHTPAMAESLTKLGQ